ncbi:MAG: E2 domain-containing protein [Pseudomonadota bacterium]|nr:E2 domain-containing protein [Pseudomonadota bacterium]
MKSAIFYLAETAPAWFSVEKSNRENLVGHARLPKTPWAVDGLHLHIFGREVPRVREEVPGTDLPCRCPERHIQGDQTFCLGLRYLKVQTAEKARQWWVQLNQFLRCQGIAELTRVWPINQALDHGDAGEHHERAISLAAEAGLEEEYASARLGEPSWLTDPKLHLFDKKGRPINGRALCPLGCKRRARGRQVTTLRTDCNKWQLLVDLAYAEHQRRKALDKYWKAVFASGEKCCRTMRRCPLAAYEDRSEGKREEN